MSIIFNSVLLDICYRRRTLGKQSQQRRSTVYIYSWIDRLIDNLNLYSASMFKKTSNALCALVEREQNGF